MRLRRTHRRSRCDRCRAVGDIAGAPSASGAGAGSGFLHDLASLRWLAGTGAVTAQWMVEL